MQSFNVEGVRRAFDHRENARRQAKRVTQRAAWAAQVQAGIDSEPQPDFALGDYRYVREVWTDFLIVENEGGDPGTAISTYTKIPYTVDSKNNVSFGQEQEVKIDYVALSNIGQSPLWVDELGDNAVDNLLQLASVRSYTRMVNGRAVRVRSYGRKGGAGGTVPGDAPKGRSPYTGAGNAASRAVPVKKAKVVEPKKEIKQAGNAATRLLQKELRGFNPANVTRDYVRKVYYRSKPSVRNALRILYPQFVAFAVKQGEIQKAKLKLSEESNHGEAVLKLLGDQDA